MSRLHVIAQIISPDEVNIPQAPLTAGPDGTISKVLQIVFGVAGAIAFLIIVLSGFRYVISQGEPQAVAKAKNAIISSLIGLAISVLGFTIVTYVVNNL